MKKLLTLPAALLIGVMLFITGCTPEDETNKCGEQDDYLRVTGFPGFFDATVFNNYLGTVKVNDVTYHAGYYENHNGSGNSLFELGTIVKQVCPYDIVNVYPSLKLSPADNSIKDTITMWSPNNLVRQSVLPVNGVYEVSEIFDTKTPSDSSETSIAVVNSVHIPYQGSRAADSLYFWNLMDEFNIRTAYRTSVDD
jgi:hypothetical protein